MKKIVIRATVVSLALWAHASWAGAEGPGDLAFSREVEEASMPVPREKAAGRTYVTAERQPYLPHQNFMGRWIDRPLFTDVSLRRSSEGESKAGFYRDIEVLKWSDFDAFGSVAYTSIFTQQMQWLAQKPVAGYGQFPILWDFYQPVDKNQSQYDTLAKMIRDASGCPAALRFGDRLFTWTWGNALDHQQEYLKKLKADPAVPKFIAMPISPFYPLYCEYVKAEAEGRDEVPAEACERYKRELTEMLAWADGVAVRIHEVYRPEDGEHAAVFLPHGLCRKYIYPLTREVMEKPEFKGKKFLGAYMEQAYVNHSNGPTTGQYGTRSLRTFLDEAGQLNLDFLVGLEWNEANENTHFQPVVSSAGTIARLVHYYKALYDGEPLTPRAGDDTSVPNLVLSVRRMMRLGETYHAELLFVPDGTRPEPFQARIVLKDGDGKVRRELPWEDLPREKLTAFNYRLASEQFGDTAVLQAVVETRAKDGRVTAWEGFDSTRFNASWCTDYLYTRQPLREMIRPAKWRFAAKPAGDGAYALSGAFDCDEPLASLEVMDGVGEVLSADRENEFDRAKYDLFRCKFHAIKSIGDAEGTIDIAGSDDWLMRSPGNAWDPLYVAPKTGKGPRKARINLCSTRMMVFAVPKADTPSAKLVFAMSYFDGCPEFPLAGLKRDGYFAHTLPNNLRIELERMDNLADYPVHLETKRASVAGTLVSARAYPQYQLRAIAKSGRVWRSPVVLPKALPPTPVTVNTFSESAKGMRPMTVCAAMLPVIDYDFADAAHVNGGSVALSETFGICGDSMSPEQLRWMVDYQMVRGINAFVFGYYAQSYARSFMLKFEPHSGPVMPMWDFMPEFFRYVDGSCTFLARGKPAAKIAVLFDQRGFWAGGRDREHAAANHYAVARALDRMSCDYDFVDDDALAEARGTTHEARDTTHEARDTRHDARSTTHDARRTFGTIEKRRRT